MLNGKGFRHNVGIILARQDNTLFWGQRYHKTGWQFPQGGIQQHESIEDAMYRELYEEVGLKAADVRVIHQTNRWYYYYLPERLKSSKKYTTGGDCIGQKQQWFLLRLVSNPNRIDLYKTGQPEFADWRWVSYWFPLHAIVAFKQPVYRKVLSFMAPSLWQDHQEFVKRGSGK